MDKLLKQKRECDSVSKHCSNSSIKRAKAWSIRKYDGSYLGFGFHCTGNIDDPLSLCLICGCEMSNESVVPSKLSKHFKTKHSCLQSESISYLKRLLEQQMTAGNSFESMTISEKAQTISYEVSELIAQNMKDHTLGESLILPACKKVVKTMLENEASKEINKIPLSNDTVNRHILEMSSNIEKNVCSNKLQYSDFALQIDESTDNANKAQLLAFIRFINEDQIINQFLSYKELKTEKGEDVSNIMNNYQCKWQISWKLYVGICTDGAASIVGCVKDLTSFVKQQNENVVITH
ncbi:zinc finger BED domain-containing protein 5-like [Octopus bimaculoides]|uniref:zinc finger BED domain-containing protein 5-like n=1 Tax=Octopus bimaculoides TaxID=37653 RepID=UPI00071E47C5|nr:zinc finger BED domain-containing protein 5-like [Octopus bimaculoides]|eukprot:XP_014768654.1 PREDICTED: zinc finger BED domain-containing protein 5-like [Octopus bimaculoides]